MRNLIKHLPSKSHNKNKLIKKVSGTIPIKSNILPTLLQPTEKKESPTPTKLTEQMRSVLEIPQEINLTIREIGQGKFLNFQTDRGILNYKWPQELPIVIKEKSGGTQELQLFCPAKEMFPTFSIATRAIHQILVGVAKGYKSKLKLVGVGYKAFLEEQSQLKISLGYSHINYHSLDSTVAVQFNRKNNRFHLSGISLPVVSSTAAVLHALKKPDVYKGKGIRYKGVALLRKEGKKKK